MKVRLVETQPGDTTLWQSNFITSARYEMTSLEKNILYMVMAQIKKGDGAGTMYLVSATELMKATGQEIKYEYLKKATGKLATRLLEGLLPSGNYLQVPFIASAEYISGKGILEIELSHKILPFFLDLKQQFTTFQLDIALSLNSIYAKRLYEILSMYKNMKDKSFKIGLQELKERMQLIDAKTGKEKYPTFTKFEDNVIKPAEREINGQTDLYFSYKAVEGKKKGKGRRPIEYLEFALIYEPVKPPIGYDEDNMPIFSRLITDYKLRKDQASSIIHKFSREDINKNLYQISIKKTNNEIKDIGAYTAKIFGLM